MSEWLKFPEVPSVNDLLDCLALKLASDWIIFIRRLWSHKHVKKSFSRVTRKCCTNIFSLHLSRNVSVVVCSARVAALSLLGVALGVEENQQGREFFMLWNNCTSLTSTFLPSLRVQQHAKKGIVLQSGLCSRRNEALEANVEGKKINCNVCTSDNALEPTANLTNDDEFKWLLSSFIVSQTHGPLVAWSEWKFLWFRVFKSSEFQGFVN